ncbi:MAG: energy transducer TonB [Deltaproteobacteria bacterium]|jgi:protein TonB|nr:energy transducer TonB [Deltaproteobacteria bacterium]
MVNNLSFDDLYDFSEDRSAFLRALALGIALHAVVIALLLLPPSDDSDLITIGYMELDYDPLGGEPGGDGFEELTAAPLAEPEQPDIAPLPEPEPEIEEFFDEDLMVIESLAEKAVEAPPPPPLPDEKEKEKPKPKPPARQQVASTATRTDGDPGPGGGGGPGTGQGGYGGGTGTGTADVLAAYKSQVRRKIERYRKYPPAARNGRLEGIVLVSFTLNRQGQVVNFKMVGSSGHTILDDEAAALIRRVNPLPNFPKELDLNILELTVPIQFALR